MCVIVSLDEQRVHVYRNGVRTAVSTGSSGKPWHETTTGVFVVLQKDRDHRSSTTNDAPMPNLNRLTWGGIALHAGNLPGYPASHGCVRLPLKFSALLFDATHQETPVITEASGSAPDSVSHPGFILGSCEGTECEKVLDRISPCQHPSDWHMEGGCPITSILESSHEERIVIFARDRQVTEGPLLWGGKPPGPHVDVLRGPDGGSRGM